MIRIIGVLLILVAVGIGLWWWKPWLHQAPESQQNSQTNSQPSCGAIAAESVSPAVTIALSQDWPHATVQLGQTVRWHNDTSSELTLQTVTAEGDECGGFADTKIAPGQNVQLTLLRSGSWSFAAGNFGGVILVP